MGKIKISDIEMVLDVYTNLYPNDDVGAAAVRQYDELLAYVKGLETAIQRALDDEESGNGWGPDCTVCAYLQAPIEKQRPKWLEGGE